jgi:hypothetical protein
VTLTFGFLFLFGGADMTVVEAEFRRFLLVPADVDLDWNGDAFLDALLAAFREAMLDTKVWD